MDFVFLDTNALIKLYLPERGATWLRNYIQTKRTIVSELSLFEVITVLRRLELEGRFTRTEVIAYQAQIERNATQYEIISIGTKPQRDRLRNITYNLTSNLRLRALDGIQVVAAQIALNDVNNLLSPNTFTFVTSDRQLFQVAQHMGFRAENPENYP
jgi:predicted nucleic acid-binding protein